MKSKRAMGVAGEISPEEAQAQMDLSGEDGDDVAHVEGHLEERAQQHHVLRTAPHPTPPQRNATHESHSVRIVEQACEGS